MCVKLKIFKCGLVGNWQVNAADYFFFFFFIVSIVVSARKSWSESTQPQPRTLSEREREKGWGKTEQALQSESNGRGKRYTICKAGLHSSIQSGAEIFALFRNKNVGRRSPFCPTLYTEYKVDSSQYVFCGWSPPFSLSFFFLGQTPFSSRLPSLLALPFCIHKSRRYMAWLGGWKFPLANLRLDKIKNFFVLFLSLLGPLKSRRK